MSTTLTFRLESETKDQLEKLSKLTNRSKSFLAAEAIKAFISQNQWQLNEIQDAIHEADAGDFASDQEVVKTLQKWT